MKNGGTYALVIRSEVKQHLPIGRLGRCEFPHGYYVYAGSALKGLESRLKRHLRAEKRLHWHIDYLLQHTGVVEVWYCRSGERLECVWNRTVTELPGAMPYIRGFGSSDCKCRTHLTCFPSLPSFAGFEKELKKKGLPLPGRLTLPSGLSML